MWSAPVLVTPPADEPISLDDAKVFLRVDDDLRDAEVCASIAGARGLIESRTSTRLLEQTVRLSADAFTDLDRLPIGPVNAVESLTYVDATGTVVPIDTDQVELFGAGLEVGVRPVFGVAWPLGATRAGAITIELTVGYDDGVEEIPGDVTLALWRALRANFEDRIPDIDQLLVNHRIWL